MRLVTFARARRGDLDALKGAKLDAYVPVQLSSVGSGFQEDFGGLQMSGKGISDTGIGFGIRSGDYSVRIKT